jgi:hypothetical protein
MIHKVLRKYIFLLIAALLLLLPACRHKKTPTPDSPPPAIDYPVGVLDSLISADLSSQTTLYPLTEEFITEFLRVADNYEGEHVHISADFPTQWGLLCVERLPEGREMWLIQSESREWVYLVITSGWGTQRVLDLVPIALNLAVQHQDILETEIWTTRREADGAFTVHKSYEWVRSVGTVTKEEVAANPENWQRNAQYTDRYKVNDLCRFDYKKIEQNRYNALFFYCNSESMPEDWDDIVSELEAYCEDQKIFYDEITEHFDQAVVRDFKFNVLDTLDLMPFINTPAGMVMITNGQNIRQVSFGSYEKLKVEIKRYFELLNK